MKVISFLNPFSSDHNAIDNYSKLEGKKQALVFALTTLATVVTLPVLGIGGLVTFRLLNEKAFPVDTKISAFAQKIFDTGIGVKDISNQEQLDLVENDGDPPLTNISDHLEEMRYNAFSPSPKDFAFETDKTDPSELIFGETLRNNGTLQCGDRQLDYACVLRAKSESSHINSTKEPGPIEDQLAYEEQRFYLNNGTFVTTTFIVSNDGNKGNAYALFYSQNAPGIFKKILQEKINDSGTSQIQKEHMLQALKETDDEVFKRRAAYLKENPKKSDGSDTTVNMIFLYPESEGVIQGGFFGLGDTRTLILKEDGAIHRIGSLKGISLGTFQAAPGDKIFISSDGIWHNATPETASEFINGRIEDHRASNPFFTQRDCMEKALMDLVNATLFGRDDDRNPMLISIPKMS